MKGFLAVSFVATILLAGTIVASLPIQDADAARASKPKEIVVVGSKVKEVIREAGLRTLSLESCSLVSIDTDGSRGGFTAEAQANNGGVVKFDDVPSEVQKVDVFCNFDHEDFVGEALDVELKERGTTDIHIKPIRIELS